MYTSQHLQQPLQQSSHPLQTQYMNSIIIQILLKQLKWLFQRVDVIHIISYFYSFNLSYFLRFIKILDSLQEFCIFVILIKKLQQSSYSQYSNYVRQSQEIKNQVQETQQRKGSKSQNSFGVRKFQIQLGAM
ncbi:hypothetical protein FGO68_gene1708 [Halteria grandinella]|uniref:Uncharacterized protein n=1 Tax=Halteria grandinella TaxID=5974 RepID=A0A8J8NIA5_HALGN|nr:hypothetical protein FGO68_gene1708 [Halteria grandinella]